MWCLVLVGFRTTVGIRAHVLGSLEMSESPTKRGEVTPRAKITDGGEESDRQMVIHRVVRDSGGSAQWTMLMKIDYAD
jgi:hypothetical protein